MIKLVVSDLDGTLLNNKKEITDKTKETLLKLKDLGIKFAICTGRPLISIMGNLKDWDLLSFCDYIIMYNGGLILDNKLNELYSSLYISTFKLNYIRDSLKHFKVQYCLFDDYLYTNELNDFVKLSSISNRCSIKVVNEDELFSKPRIKIGVRFNIDDFNEIDLLVNSFNKQGLNACYSGKNYLEITDISATKGKGIKRVCDMLAISTDDVLAFGDEGNDIDMFKTISHSICMINGNNNLKLLSEDVTEFDNNHDGVANYLLKYIIK